MIVRVVWGDYPISISLRPLLSQDKRRIVPYITSMRITSIWFLPMKSSVAHPRLFVTMLFSTFVLAAWSRSSLHAQQTITGDLGVSGILDVNGNSFNLGTSTYDTTKYGFSVGYAEDANTHAATLSLTATRPTATWLWQQAASNNGTGSAPKMCLSAGNALTLYDQATPTPNAAIVLDPVNGSTFGTATTFNGANNQMPNQQASSAGSVLTVSLGDGRYVLRGTSTSLSLGYLSNASGTNSTALGAFSSATGNYSTALSFDSHATNTYTAALGNGSMATGASSTSLGTNSAATGDNSVTVGNTSRASGWGAAAFGIGSQAIGQTSTALGPYSQAAGNYATALGAASSAAFDNSSALGQFSRAWGTYSTALGYLSTSSNNAASALGAFSTASGSLSTALGHNSVASGTGSVAIGFQSVASGDQATSIGFTTATSLDQLTVGLYNITGGNPHAWVPTDDLFTVGNGTSATATSNAFSVKKNGDTSVGGKLVVTGPIIVQPQGDLSMGAFTATPSPTP